MFVIYFIITSLISEMRQWGSVKLLSVFVALMIVYNAGLIVGVPSQIFLQRDKNKSWQVELIFFSQAGFMALF